MSCALINRVRYFRVLIFSVVAGAKSVKHYSSRAGNSRLSRHPTHIFQTQRKESLIQADS